MERKIDFKYLVIYRIVGEEAEPARSISVSSKKAKSVDEAIAQVRSFCEYHGSTLYSIHAEAVRNPRPGRPKKSEEK